MRGLSLAVSLAVLLWRMPADYGIYLYIDSLEEREGVGGEGECCENMTIVESIKTRKIACDIQYTQDDAFVVFQQFATVPLPTHRNTGLAASLALSLSPPLPHPPPPVCVCACVRVCVCHSERQPGSASVCFFHCGRAALQGRVRAKTRRTKSLPQRVSAGCGISVVPAPTGGGLPKLCPELRGATGVPLITTWDTVAGPGGTRCLETFRAQARPGHGSLT